MKPLTALLACALTSGALAAPAPASDPAPAFSLTDFGRLVRLGAPVLSPDGQRVALVVSRPDPVENRTITTLNLIDAQSGAQQVIASGEISHPAWSPSGDRLAWLAADGDKTLQINLYAFDSDVGLPSVITETPRGAGVQQFAWSPDGQSLAYLATEAPLPPSGDARFDHTFEVPEADDLGTTYLARAPGAAPARLWLLPAAGGKARLLSAKTDHIEQLAWQADGRSVLINSHPGSSVVAQRYGSISAISVVDGAESPVVARPANVGTDEAMSVSSKGLLAYQHFRGQDPWLHNSDVSVVADGHAREVTNALDRHIQAFSWLPDGATLLVGALERVRRGLWTVPMSGPAQRVELGTVNPDSTVSVSRSGALAFIASEPLLAPELYVMASPTAKPVRLTHFNAAIEHRRLGKVEVVHWRNDGFDHAGLLYFPPDFRPDRHYPLLVNIHGGPHTSSQLSFDGEGQFYAANHWLVFEPNYRGSDGQGERYRTAVIGDATAGPGRDLMAGIAVVKARGIVDDKGIALTGWSYGGVMTSWLIGHHHDWCAAIPGALVIDFADYYNQSETGIWIGSLLGSPHLKANRDRYREQSPATYLFEATTPTLVMHSTGDPNAPVTQAYALYHALKDRGVKTRFVIFGMDGHGPGDPFHERQAYVRTLAWMNENCPSGAHSGH
jgi:dipeptidyl aminopeptidase/acylaminoacyl peptidase